MFLSAVIPAFNEASNISKVIAELENTIQKTPAITEYEIIVCDDHSSDSTFEVVKALNKNNIHSLRLSRRSGSHTALRAGIKRAKGDVVLCISADGQDNPEVLSEMVQKIKDAIVEMVFNDENAINVKSSVYLSEKLNLSFGYLSNLFSEVTHTSIENFIIIQKIERVKQLIIINELSLTEIAYLLSYSSVAHLSTQFKNTTGITASAFQRIIEKRRENLNQ